MSFIYFACIFGYLYPYNIEIQIVVFISSSLLNLGVFRLYEHERKFSFMLLFLTVYSYIPI